MATKVTHVTINAMAPLLVGDPANQQEAESQRKWNEFDQQLVELKKLGVDAVSTDVWWGLVEPAEGVFDWSYYDRLSDHIIAAGLKWVPIISFHQCGGNIGDDVFEPVPAWVWTKLAGMVPSHNIDAAKYVSEQGNASSEYVSVWATDLVLGNYKALMASFQAHFASKAKLILEVNVSLGPAGELRYPSYNSHDKGTDYPTRGALQCYSELAIESFRDFVFAKYTNEDGIATAWGNRYSRDQIRPPQNAGSFLKSGQHKSLAYGRDLFDWYQDSLIAHGRKVMNAALDVFSSDGAAFKGIDLGAKMPGVHWRIGYHENGRIVLSDRFAELAAGLIRTSGNDWESDDLGRGYRPMVSLFKELNERVSGQTVILHFTCLEMGDERIALPKPTADGEKIANCMPRTLVGWVGAEAQRQGVIVKGENALGWNIPVAQCWQRMREALASPVSNGLYYGLTLLRMGDILSSDTARHELKQITDKSNPSVAVKAA